MFNKKQIHWTESRGRTFGTGGECKRSETMSPFSLALLKICMEELIQQMMGWDGGESGIKLTEKINICTLILTIEYHLLAHQWSSLLVTNACTRSHINHINHPSLTMVSEGWL